MRLVSNYLYSYQKAQEGIEKVVHFASAFLTHLLMPGSRFSSSPANVVFLTERRRPRLSKSLRQLGSYPSIEHHSWTCEWRQQQYQYGQRKICHLTIPERMWNILYQKNPQILRQLITKLSFTQRCSLIYFASVHLYCATNDLENIYSISYWIYHFSIREDFFNEQHKRIVMALHSSPLVGWCLFVFFFIVVLIMYIFQHFVRRSFCSLSTWRQVLLGRLPFLSYQSCFMLHQLNTFTPNEQFMNQNEIKWSLIIKELNVLEKHFREKVWLADSL